MYSEIEKCKTCGISFESLEYDPHYDAYGLMGNGYTKYYYCPICRKKLLEDHL